MQRNWDKVVQYFWHRGFELVHKSVDSLKGFLPTSRTRANVIFVRCDFPHVPTPHVCNWSEVAVSQHMRLEHCMIRHKWMNLCCKSWHNYHQKMLNFSLNQCIIKTLSKKSWLIRQSPSFAFHLVRQQWCRDCLLVKCWQKKLSQVLGSRHAEANSRLASWWWHQHIKFISSQITCCFVTGWTYCWKVMYLIPNGITGIFGKLSIN